MWQLARAFVEIVLRRRGPESLPDSTFLVLLTIVLIVALGVLSNLLLYELTPLYLLVLAVRVVLFLAFVYAVLSFFKLERRFRQTVAAWIGAELVISAFFLPLALLFVGFGLDVTSEGFIWLGIVEFLCIFVVGSRIMARSLSQPLIVGIMFTILYYLTALGVVDFFAPDPAVQGVASGA